MVDIIIINFMPGIILDPSEILCIHVPKPGYAYCSRRIVINVIYICKSPTNSITGSFIFQCYNNMISIISCRRRKIWCFRSCMIFSVEINCHRIIIYRQRLDRQSHIWQHRSQRHNRRSYDCQSLLNFFPK